MAKPLHYFEMGPYPLWFGLCTCPKEFAREMKRMGIKEPEPFVTDQAAGATTHTFTHTKRSQWTVIVCVNLDIGRKVHRHELVGLLAHEATHTWQRCLQAMRASEPDEKEFAAYFIQYVTQRMVQYLCP